MKKFSESLKDFKEKNNFRKKWAGIYKNVVETLYKKQQIKIEKQIKKNNNVIKLYKNNTNQDKPSAFDVWKAEAFNIKLKKEWKEIRTKNIKLSNKK